VYGLVVSRTTSRRWDLSKISTNLLRDTALPEGNMRSHRHQIHAIKLGWMMYTNQLIRRIFLGPK